MLGFVLLAFEKYNAAKLMFERSLEEKMGRTWSLVGLARSHTMLGDSTKARAANDPSVFTITTRAFFWLKAPTSKRYHI